MVETWWSSENCFQAVLRQSLKAENAAGVGHRLVKPFSPGASMRGAVSEGCKCLEVISVLSTLWRRINPKRNDLLKRMQPWLVFTSHNPGQGSEKPENIPRITDRKLCKREEECNSRLQRRRADSAFTVRSRTNCLLAWNQTLAQN